MKKLFIDGQVGTTGLQIKERLSLRTDIELIEIEEEKRKDPVRKAEILNSVDVAILCLPDFAAKESVALIENKTTRVIDASTAHRTNPDWAYGFAELSEAHRAKIAASQFVANPGCHATGFIATANPLVAAGIIPTDYPVSITSLTGYSGGGRQLIEKYQAVEGNRDAHAVRPYALSLSHKHLPEMKDVVGLDFAPAFYPVVGDFERGMLVSTPLFSRLLSKKVSAADVHAILSEHYANEHFVTVKPFDSEAELTDGAFLTATDCNDTNNLEIFVFGHEEQIMLVSRLDNLGKGASGAAVQNLNIMLGLDEKTSL